MFIIGGTGFRFLPNGCGGYYANRASEYSIIGYGCGRFVNHLKIRNLNLLKSSDTDFGFVEVDYTWRIVHGPLPRE